MPTPEEKLAELGLSVPEVAKPVAAYIPANRSGDLVYTSGQLPMRDGQLMFTGKVGGRDRPTTATPDPAVLRRRDDVPVVGEGPGLRARVGAVVLLLPEPAVDQGDQGAVRVGRQMQVDHRELVVAVPDDGVGEESGHGSNLGHG